MARFSTPVNITPKTPPAPPAPPAPARVRGVSTAKPNTTNVAGGEAYKLPIRHEIASVVLNCMLNDRFYTSAQENMNQLHDLVARADKAGEVEFLAKAAIYARHTHGLRTVSHILAGEVGDLARGTGWKRSFYAALPQRPDDVTEVLAYWNMRHPGKRHPNPMVRGFGTALGDFDAYALAKYRGQGGKGVNLVDAVNICHPATGPGHPLHRLMAGTLQAADTWEKALSEAGQATESGEVDDDAKGAAWARLLSERKLGYLACLRNLRNIAQQAPDVLPKALELIADPGAVRKARIFPFQYVTAYRVGAEMGGPLGKAIQTAVQAAADHALSNVPQLPGKTLVAVDVSGSMTSGKATDGRSCIEVASLFAAALMKGLPDAEYMQFESSAKFAPLDTVGLSMFALADDITRRATGGGTNFHSIFEECARARKSYDRVIILSDMQGWMQGGVQGMFASYAKAVMTDIGRIPKLYSFDLSGNGTAQFPASQVCLLAGFSDKIFDVMGQMEVDRDALVKQIADVSFVPKRRTPKPEKLDAPVKAKPGKKASRAAKGDKSAKARRAKAKPKAKPRK